MTNTFSDLGLNEDLLKAVARVGYEEPSQIQRQAIPVILSGKDIVGLSETGSGKTAAFGLPALQKLDKSLGNKPQVLILCPTRELCLQVCEEMHRFCSHLSGVSLLPVYGGAPMERQIKALRSGVHLVVGTPGRVLDLSERGHLVLDNVHTVVLDEADRMLDMGFQEDMEAILGQTPEERQTLFFSATMNKAVSRIIENHAHEPEQILVKRKSLTVDTIEQSYFEVRSRSKVEVLSRLLDMEAPRLAIVFCNTKSMVDDVFEVLLARGYTVEKLHGDISQTNREKAIRRFREAKAEILVATDVAARGLDIEAVDAVFNYDMPHDPEDYVHRIGRTGRAGRSGKAFSFVFGKEIHRLESVEKFIRSTIHRSVIPSVESVEGRKNDQIFLKIRETLENAQFEDFTPHLDRLLEQGHTPTDIANALFTLLRKEDGREAESIAEDSIKDTGERPRREKKGPYKKRGGNFGKKEYREGSFGGSREKGPFRGKKPFRGDSKKAAPKDRPFKKFKKNK